MIEGLSNRSRFFIKFSILLVFSLTSCTKKPNKINLSLSHEEIVSALVDLYSIKAAVNINHLDFHDSLEQVYFSQYEAISGIKIDLIKSDLAKLLEVPDTLIMLQNRAMDSLSRIQGRELARPAIDY